MKIQRKILILTIFDVLILIGLVFSFIHFLKAPSPYVPEVTKYLTDIDKLYSSFTDYMTETVDSYLKTIGCKPKKYYYYDDSKICFVCGNTDACFGYAWVTIPEGEKRNPKGIPLLTGNYNKETEINFYSFGIAKLLNYKCEKECICDEGIKAELERGLVTFTFPEDVNIKEKVEKIAKLAGYDECKFEDKDFNCGNLAGIMTSSDEVIFTLIYVYK